MKPEILEDDALYALDTEDIEFDYDAEDDDDDDFDDFEMDYYDDDDDDDDDDDAEDLLFDMDDFDDIERKRRRRRRRRRRKNTGKGKGYWQKQMRGLATKKEVKAGFARVGRDVRKNGAAIKSNARAISRNSSRVRSVGRVNRAQSKAIAKIRKDMADQRQFQMLMALLNTGSKTYKVEKYEMDDLNRVTEISLDEQGDELTALLPLLSGGGGSGGGLGDNPLMLLLLAGGLK